MKRQISHAVTLKFLKRQGYPLPLIRQALVRLAGRDHQEIGSILGKSRSVITSTLSGARAARDVREGISAILGVSTEELFNETAAEDHAR